MTHDSENMGADSPATYQHITSNPAVAGSIVSAVATNAWRSTLDTTALTSEWKCMPGTVLQQRFWDITLETCSLNFPAVRLAPVTAAEIMDLKTKFGDSKTKAGPPKTKAGGPKTKCVDPETLPDSVIHLSAFYIQKTDLPGVHARLWTRSTRAHIDRTCTRMWRPAKGERQQIRNNNITTSQGLTELYSRCFPDQTVMEGGNNARGPRKWEVLLPHLVTFVLCDVEPEDDAPPSPPRAELPATSSSSAASVSQSAAAGPSSPGPSSSAPAPCSKPSKPSKPSKSKKSKRYKPKAGRHQHTLGRRRPTPSTPPTPPPPDPSTPPQPQRPQKPMIRYLPVGTRDKQPSAEFCAALTAAFASERVLAPDLQGRWIVAEARMRRRWMGRFLEEEGKGKWKELDWEETEKRNWYEELSLPREVMMQAVHDTVQDVRQGLVKEDWERDTKADWAAQLGKADGVEGQKQGGQNAHGVEGTLVKNGQGSGQEPKCVGNKGKDLDTADYGRRREQRFDSMWWPGDGLPLELPIEQRTVLVFAAGVCVGPRGGIGVVTKETVHYHERPVWERIVDAERRLSAGRRSPFHEDDLRKVGLCTAALEKPGRGFRLDLHRAEPPKQMDCALLGGAHGLAMERWALDTNPARFGYVESRYRPAWMTLNDGSLDERYYYLWGRARQRMEERAKQYRLESGAVGGGAVDGGGGANHGAGGDGKELDVKAGDDKGGAKIDGLKDGEAKEDDESEDNEEGGPPLYADMDAGEENDDEDAKEDMDLQEETEEEVAESNNGNENPSEPKPKKHIMRATPNRVAARALLAAVQMVPFDFSHCTRLIIATDSEHVIEMATNRLQNMLERELPFRTARGQPVEDEDIWWQFAGAVKDLAYQGVEVAIMRCREGEGIRLPLGDGDGYVFGMDQAIKAAKHAATALWRRDKEAREHHKPRGDLEFVRWMNLYA